MNSGRPDDADRMGLTRWRDLAAVALVAAIIGFGMLALSYHRIPLLPRAVGAPAALLGVAEAIAALGMRSRLHPRDKDAPRRPVDPLLAARTVMLAKASALAAAAFGGLCIGALVYLVPEAGSMAAAATDRGTVLIALLCAVVMEIGALLLEYSCRAPDDPEPPIPGAPS